MLLPLPIPLSTQAAIAETAVPPVARRKPQAMVKFGVRRVDNYAWLRDKSDPEVIAHLDRENRYTEAVMQPLAGFRDSLYKEILARIQETDESVPYPHHGYWYYVREVEGLQYPIYCRRKGSMEAREEIVLDVNELARGHAYTSVGVLDVSPDATKVAYTVDFTGYRQYTLHIKELATGELVRETAERVTSIAWAADNRTIFYVQEHETTKRSYQLHRRVIGEPLDTLLYEEADEHYDIGVGDTRSERYLVLGITSKDASEMRILAADDPAGEFRVVEPRRAHHEY
jgi:oligopeptidase B